MIPTNLLNHPSLQREFARLCALGAGIEVENGNRITIQPGVVPLEVVEDFVKRIHLLDPAGTLEIQVMQKRSDTK